MSNKQDKEEQEEEIREKYMQFKVLQQHIEQLTEQVEALNQQNAEIAASQTALAEVKKTPLKTEILTPIANGIFLKTALTNNTNLLVNVGANVTVERTVEEVISLLEQQKKEMTEKVIEGEALLQDLQQQAMTIYREVEKHVQ